MLRHSNHAMYSGADTIFFLGIGNVITTKSDFIEFSCKYSLSRRYLLVLSCTAKRSLSVISPEMVQTGRGR